MFTTLETWDLQWAVRNLPPSVAKLMKKDSSVVCAGGFVRSCVLQERPNDVDLFCSSRDQARTHAIWLANGEKNIYETENAYSVKSTRPMTQFIHRWTYDSKEVLVQSFDFTIAQACIWYEDRWRSLCSQKFYPDLAAKRLIYTSPQRHENAGGSILRVLKFYQRGFRIPLDSMGAVIARMMQGVRPEAFDSEPQLAKILTGLLREVDPNIDPEHMGHIPSDLGEDVVQGGADGVTAATAN